MIQEKKKTPYPIILLMVTAVIVAACTPVPPATPPSPTAEAATNALPTPTALPAASPTPSTTEGETPMPANNQAATKEIPIRVIIGDTVLTARLWDNATARDLIAQLPLTLPFSDYGRQEKLATLPRKLSMEGAPAGDDPRPREIGYYAPAGVIVFYDKDVGYFSGIVRLGQFDGDMNALTSQTSDFVARIEFAD